MARAHGVFSEMPSRNRALGDGVKLSAVREVRDVGIDDGIEGMRDDTHSRSRTHDDLRRKASDGEARHGGLRRKASY